MFLGKCQASQRHASCFWRKRRVAHIRHTFINRTSMTVIESFPLISIWYQLFTSQTLQNTYGSCFENNGGVVSPPSSRRYSKSPSSSLQWRLAQGIETIQKSGAAMAEGCNCTDLKELFPPLLRFFFGKKKETFAWGVGGGTVLR